MLLKAKSMFILLLFATISFLKPEDWLERQIRLRNQACLEKQEEIGMIRSAIIDELREERDSLSYQFGLALSKLDALKRDVREGNQRIELLEQQLGIPAGDRTNQELLNTNVVLQGRNQKLEREVDSLRLSLGTALSTVEALEKEKENNRQYITELEARLERINPEVESVPQPVVQDNRLRNRAIGAFGGVFFMCMVNYLWNHYRNHDTEAGRLRDQLAAITRERDGLAARVGVINAMVAERRGN